MHGDEDVALVLGREHLAVVELHPERRDVGAEQLRGLGELGARAVLAVLRVERGALVAERVAEVRHRRLRRHAMQRIVRRVVAHPVASVVGEPQVLVLRVEVHADRVAHAHRDGLERPLVRVDPRDRSLRVIWQHDVARGADVEVQLAVRPHHQVFPEMPRRAAGIEIVDHHLALARTVELALDPVVARDAPALRDIQRALAEGDAVGRVEAAQDGLHLALAAAADHRVDVLRVAVADEQRALVAHRHRASLGNAIDPYLDLEARRHLERVDRQVLGRAPGHVGREGMQSRLRQRGRLALLPRGWR